MVYPPASRDRAESKEPARGNGRFETCLTCSNAQNTAVSGVGEVVNNKECKTCERKESAQDPTTVRNTLQYHPKRDFTYFSESVLEKLGSINVLNAKTDLLRNEIHPMFQKANWDETLQDAWEPLVPVLRLASRFVGHNEMLPFWHQLLYDRRVMPKLSAKFGHETEHFCAIDPLEETQARHTACFLAFYGKVGVWKIGFYDRNDERSAHAYTRRDTGNPMGTGTFSFIKLSLVYREILTAHASGHTSLPHSQLLRVQFSLATTIIHEVAHAVRNASSFSEHEPYYGDQILNELGRAWESWAFGGILHPVCGWKDMRLGITLLTPWPPWWQQNPPGERNGCPLPQLIGDLPESTDMWVVSMEYIQLVQTEEFWRGDIPKRGIAALKIPQTIGRREWKFSGVNDGKSETVYGGECQK
ncbi:hypothetical protein MMC28_004323 [Mycoblastus sanguinarius]|nr:hypothetical protein [Mycoblastus sanguinarius]